ncbi:MAG: copper chaperone PCu(A)C [Novosphingobium sp.]
MRAFKPLAIGIGVTLVGTVLALGGCQESVEPAGEASGKTSAAPDAKSGLSLSEARLTLPAVGGRPGAVYFTLRNTGAVSVKAVAVHIEGATRAEMHETSGRTMKPLATLVVPPGATIAFAPGGRHVMVFGIAPSLVAGTSTEMTMSFANGETLAAPVAVRAPGDGDAHAMKMDMR